MLKNIISFLLLMATVGCQILQEPHIVSTHSMPTPEHFYLRGRFSIHETDHHLSGKITWLQKGDIFQIRLSHALAGKSLAITGQPGVYSIVTSDGLSFATDTLESLQDFLYDNLNYHLPLHHLKYWALGQKVVHKDGSIHINNEPEGFVQYGWHLQYNDFFEGTPYPRKIDLKNNDYRIRIFIAYLSDEQEDNS